MKIRTSDFMKKSVKLLGIAPLLSLLFCGYFNTTSSKHNNDIKCASSALSQYDTSGTIFYSQTSDEVLQYYSSIEKGDSGDTLLDKLQALLKKDPLTNKNQAKVTYSSGSSKSSTNWAGYYLYERDYKLSPLTQTEISTGNYLKTGIWVNLLYCESPIYISNSINSGSYTYYTDWNPDTHSGTTTKTGTFSSGNAQFDREHVFPKSFGFNGANDKYKDLITGCDAHNLRTGEHEGNSSAHSNLPYGTVEDKSEKTKYYSKLTGELVGYAGINKQGIKVFEPCDNDKGDIARACFYMAARYHNYEVDINNSNYHSPALTLDDGVMAVSTTEPEATENSPCAYGELSDLLEWNKLDPVDEEEIRRNDLVYNGIQYNRNPFVDFPSWADACFSNGTVKFNDINIRQKYLGEPLTNFDEDNGIESITASLGLTHQINNSKPEKLLSVDEIDENASYVLGIKDGEQYRIATSSLSNNKLTSTLSSDINSSLPHFSLKKEAGGYTIKVQNNYLGYAGTSTNLKLTTTLDDSCYWDIAYQDDGFVITNKSVTSGSRALIFRKGTYNYFACYDTRNLTSSPTEYFKIQIFNDVNLSSDDIVLSDFYIKYNATIKADFYTNLNISSQGLIIAKTSDITSKGYTSIYDAYEKLNNISEVIKLFENKNFAISDDGDYKILTNAKSIDKTDFNTSYSAVFYIVTGNKTYFSEQIDYSVNEMIDIYYHNSESLNSIQKTIINSLYQAI